MSHEEREKVYGHPGDLTPEEEELERKAFNAVADPDEVKARHLSWELLDNLAEEELKRPLQQGRRLRKVPVGDSEKGPWYDVVAKESPELLGFDFLRTDYEDDVSFAVFKAELEIQAKKAMQSMQPREEFDDKVWQSFSYHWVEDKANLNRKDGKELISYFQVLVERNAVPPGFRRDYILSWVATDPIPFGLVNIRIWDAAFDEAEKHLKGYNGCICLDVPDLMSVVMPNIVQVGRPAKHLEMIYRMGHS